MVDSAYSSYGFQYFVLIFFRHVTGILNICMVGSAYFVKSTPPRAFNMVGSAYFVKSTPPRAFVVPF